MSPIERRLVDNGGYRWIGISLTVSIIPVMILALGLMPSLIVLSIIWLVPYIGSMVQVVVYICAIMQLLKLPFSLISILFILSLIVYFIYVIIPFIANRMMR